MRFERVSFQLGVFCDRLTPVRNHAIQFETTRYSCANQRETPLNPRAYPLVLVLWYGRFGPLRFILAGAAMPCQHLGSRTRVMLKMHKVEADQVPGDVQFEHPGDRDHLFP